MLAMWYNEVTKLAVPVSALTPTGTSPKQTHWRCVAMDNPIVPQRKNTVMPELYHALAEKRGMKWLGPYTGRVLALTSWQCKNGHTFEMPYSSLKNPKNGCTKCSRCQPEDYVAAAEKYGYTWMGPEVRTSAVKTWWRCKCGHEWQASLNALKGCMKCSKKHVFKMLRNGPSEYHELADACGLEWIGPEVENSSTPTNWKCNSGHEFSASYSSLRRGRKCHRCRLDKHSDTRRIKPEQYHAIAEQRGYKWLGPEVSRSTVKTGWLCPNGHVWFTTRDTIAKGANCPECQGLVNGRRISKPQCAVCDMVGGVLNYKIGRCTVDVALFIGDEKIGIEYDCYYWHAKTQENDMRRAWYMVRRGWKVLRIKTNSKVPTESQLRDAIDVLIGGAQYGEIVMDDWGKVDKANEFRYIKTRS